MKEQICMLWAFFKHPAGVLNTPAQWTVAELYASLKGKCYLGFPNSRHILCVMYIVLHLLRWVLQNKCHTFPAQVTVTYPTTFLGSNEPPLPLLYFTPSKHTLHFLSEVSEFSFPSSCHLPLERAFLPVVLTVHKRTKACFWKAVCSRSSSCPSFSFLPVFPSSPFMSLITHCLSHLFTPHLQHYPLHWYCCPDYNCPEATEDL